MQTTAHFPLSMNPALQQAIDTLQIQAERAGRAVHSAANERSLHHLFPAESKRISLPPIAEMLSALPPDLPHTNKQAPTVAIVAHELNLINNHINSDRFVDALFASNQLNKNFPADPRPYYYMGCCYFVLHQERKGLDHFQFAVNYSSTSEQRINSLKQIINFLFSQGQYGLTLSAAEQMHALQKDHLAEPYFRFMLGIAAGHNVSQEMLLLTDALARCEEAPAKNYLELGYAWCAVYERKYAQAAVHFQNYCNQNETDMFYKCQAHLFMAFSDASQNRNIDKIRHCAYAITLLDQWCATDLFEHIVKQCYYVYIYTMLKEKSARVIADDLNASLSSEQRLVARSYCAHPFLRWCAKEYPQLLPFFPPAAMPAKQTSAKRKKTIQQTTNKE